MSLRWKRYGSAESFDDGTSIEVTVSVNARRLFRSSVLLFRLTIALDLRDILIRLNREKFIVVLVMYVIRTWNVAS